MRRLLPLFMPISRGAALAVALGAAVIASNMGLLAAAAYLIAAAAVTHLMALLIIPMYAVRILSAARGTARYAERLLSHRVTFDLLARLRVRLFDRLRQLGPAGLQGVHSGDALGRVMADVEELQNVYLLLVAPAIVALIVSALLILALRPFGAALAPVMAGYLVLAGVALPLIAAVLTRHAGRALVTTRAELNAHLVDSVQGSRDLLSNGAGDRYLARTVRLSRRLARAESRLAGVSAGREGALELCAGLAVLTALSLAIPLVSHGALSGLYIAVPALLTLAAFEAIRPLGPAAESVSSVQAAGRRIASLGAGTVQVAEPDAPVPLLPPYSITFEDVTLAYAGSGRPALQDVSFEVPAGGRVALVGPSGAGKSSLARLLVRAWDPTRGRVLVGGRDIRQCSQRDLRAVMSVVAQDTYIFDDTIRSNLLLAHPGASTGDLEEALHAAGLLDLVRDLPEGLDTWVGEHGERLSGGERQRLAVARMLLQDAPIVVLDEVTANLDPATERALLDALQRATEGRTVLTITHRLLQLDRMDEIVVLDRGRLIERGSHEELLAADGLYRRMMAVQDDMLVM